MSDQMPSYPTPPPGFQQVAAAPTPPAQGFAITSMVLGIVGVFGFWFYAVIPILAIIFGGVAISSAKKVGAKPSGMAIAGLVLGIIFTAIFVILVLVGVAIVNG
jgi:hypothetical protein